MFRAWQSCFLGLLLTSCRGGEPTHEIVYGQPIGIQMAAARGLPAFEIAIAVSGAEAEPLVSPVSAAIHEALRGCPDVVARGASGEGTQASFAIEGGRVHGGAGAADDACLLRALAGKAITAPTRVDVIVQLRFVSDADGGAPPG